MRRTQLLSVSCLPMKRVAASGRRVRGRHGGPRPRCRLSPARRRKRGRDGDVQDACDTYVTARRARPRSHGSFVALAIARFGRCRERKRSHGASRAPARRAVERDTSWLRSQIRRNVQYVSFGNRSVCACAAGRARGTAATSSPDVTGRRGRRRRVRRRSCLLRDGSRPCSRRPAGASVRTCQRCRSRRPGCRQFETRSRCR